ncbi:MAG: hypothetical protein KF871_11120 [Hydrogenophaga sp.]|uniref:hypothetical protein n=1 Tax=Hydrogenophaga sp. TaxID=1904254 RepID=UPI001D7CF9CC|nr:hypothetical protein [Hydrogenophaga sp.]MBX3610434.1 hypothetical protein [Hydrogenophaga sp.]
MNPTTHDALTAFRGTLQALQAQDIGAAEAARRLRDIGERLDTLPPRFGEVLQGLLDRLEFSALFDAESCSFSAHDLYDSLRFWVDQTERRLSALPASS